MEQKQLIYWQRYNQYYKPIEIDTEHKVCKMVVAKNKRDKTITRDKIARVELYPEWKYVIYKNAWKTAEQNFLDVVRAPGGYQKKLNELSDFKRHGLTDSEKAMGELTYIFQKGFDDCISDQDHHFRQRVKTLYLEILLEQSKNDNQKTYDQRVPAEIVELAKSKGLLIERVDDYIVKNGRRAKTNKVEKQKIRERKPCGYLIRNARGRTIVGNGYKLTSANVVEFIQKFVPCADVNKPLPHTVRDRKSKEKPLSVFWKLVHSDDPMDRKNAAQASFVSNIAEREIVIDVLKKKVVADTDFQVRKTMMDTLHRFNAVNDELLEQYRKKNSQEQRASQSAPLKQSGRDDRFLEYNNILKGLPGRKKSKNQKKLEKRERNTGVSLDIIKKLKKLNPNACIVKSGGKNGKYQIAGYSNVCVNFEDENDILKWINTELKKEKK